MEEIKLKLNEKGHGGFYIMDGKEELGEMVISVSNKDLTVHHTEVVEKAGGRGLAKQMLNAMTDYARKNNLKVIPLCPYVHAQFKRHPGDYADIWNKEEQE